MTNGGDGISGHKMSRETVQKIADKNRGKKWTDTQKENLREIRKNSNAFEKMSPETQRKTLERLTKQPQISCIHCRKTCNYSLIVQWHGDKCKQRLQKSI